MKKIKITKRDLKNLAVYVVISIVVLLYWRWLELLYYNQTTPTVVDSIIGLILSFSLFGNYLLYNKLKDNKER